MPDSPRNLFRTLRRERLDYGAGISLQETCLAERCAGEEDILILLEHTPVITYGRGAAEGNLLVSREQLAREGIELHLAGRGGDMTYHGPGQLVGYPIIDLNAYGRDLHRFLRMLEDVLIRAVAGLGVTAHRREGQTGIWVDDGKLASIGVGVRRWTSWHGFALNLRNELGGFERIIPCGLNGVRMVSLEQLLPRAPGRQETEAALIASFAEVFDSRYLGDYEIETTTQT